MPETVPETEAEKKAAEEAAAEAEEPTEETPEDDLGLDGEFDPDRAMATIRKQRVSEARLKAELAEAKVKAEAFDAAEAEKAEAEKTAEQKVQERESKIEALERQIAEKDIKHDFKRAAIEAGIAAEDLDLAYLAAREQGLLGSRDPKTEVVDGHDFESLEAKHPALFGGGGVRVLDTGDAGRRGRGKVASPNEVFTRLIRDAARR